MDGVGGGADRRLAGAVEWGRPIQILVDGCAATACEGESVAAALLASGRRELRVTPRRGEPRECTAGYDPPVPFPGWTLPGVLAAGGAGIDADRAGTPG
jgi:hypothetical protein